MKRFRSTSTCAYPRFRRRRPEAVSRHLEEELVQGITDRYRQVLGQGRIVDVLEPEDVEGGDAVGLPLLDTEGDPRAIPVLPYDRRVDLSLTEAAPCVEDEEPPVIVLELPGVQVRPVERELGPRPAEESERREDEGAESARRGAGEDPRGENLVSHRLVALERERQDLRARRSLGFERSPARSPRSGQLPDARENEQDRRGPTPHRTPSLVACPSRSPLPALCSTCCSPPLAAPGSTPSPNQRCGARGKE